MTVHPLHYDCIGCRAQLNPEATTEQHVLAVLATVSAVGLEQAMRDLCAHHRQLVDHAADMAREAVPQD